MAVSPEEVAIKVASGPISRILGGAMQGLASLPGYLRKQAELSDFLGSVTKKYTLHCLDIYQNMRILAMPRPIELQQIYTQVRVANQITRRLNITEIDILRNILTGKDENKELLTALSIAKSVPRFVLLGRPGSGKSTFLKYLLLRELRERAVEQIPILIALNQLHQNALSITSAISSTFARCGIEFSVELTERLLETGKLRLLIDGLDELRHAERHQAITEIELLTVKYRSCSFIVTCRSSAYEFWFSDYHHYEIERFSRRAILSFVSRWFVRERTKARELARQIVSNSRLRDLCSNPLMLTIVCIGFADGIDVSTNRAELYKDAIDVLLRRWDASKNVYRDNLYKALTPKRREDLLCDLAARTFTDDQVVFSEQRAVEIVGQFIEAIPKTADSDIEDARGVLTAIETQHGLLEMRSRVYWAFAHLTFQEYFTAQYLVARDPELRTRVVERYVERPDWREVMLLTASLLPNADEFVISILRSMTRMGYGAFFARHVQNEIDEARRSLQHRRHDASTVFPKDDDNAKTKRIARSNLRLIEGGLSLNLSDKQRALDHFRTVVALRIGRPVFEGIWKLILTGLATNMELEVLLRGIPESDYEVNADKSSIDLSRARSQKRGIARAMPKTSNYMRRFDVACQIMKKNNANLEKNLGSLFSPANIFELTDRKHFWLIPQCAGRCVGAATELIDGLDYTGIYNVLRGRLEAQRVVTDSTEDQRRYIDIFKSIIVEQVQLKISTVAERNALESIKLKAFVAGETLSEILLSPVFLTPRVREAAINTLDNLIGNIPPPPAGPYEDVKAERSAKKQT